MRSLVLSDIHGNLGALEAVLETAPPSSYDRLLVLGDLVGYGANPNEVVDRIFALGPHVLIRGNHDRVSSGREEPTRFNRIATLAALWTREALTENNRKRLADLPAGPIIVDGQIEVCHGSPVDEDTYVIEKDDALQALQATERPLCLFGHTHLPGVFEHDGPVLNVVTPNPGEQLVVTIQPNHQYLINPGSVGQPRDGNPRAAFATFDSEQNELVLRRIDYPVDSAQRKIVGAGLPGALADRLSLGR